MEEALKNFTECKALLPIDWKISEETVVQPDNNVIRYEPEGDYLNRAPILIFEVTSPSSATKDRGLKYRIYEHEGVESYCVVDSEEDAAKIYKLVQGRYLKAKDVSKEKVVFDLGCCEIAFDFSLVWK